MEREDQVTKREIATDTESEEEEEDDDGPPPGFQCIINRQPPPAAADDEEDDGPPPGFDSIAPRSSSPGSPENESDGFCDTEKGDEIEDSGDDGPPPDIKGEINEDLDEGPPPGWETPFPRTPPLQSSSSVSSSIEIESKEKIKTNDDEMPPIPGHSFPVSTPSEVPSNAAANKVTDKKVRIKRPTFGNQYVSPKPHPQPPSSDKAQLICGKCRKLCLYPRGAKWVQCPGCQEANFVLEAHEVGQVRCGGCEVLLMYPHGAPVVQCTCCQFVNEIGEGNRRPPLSVQLAVAQRRVRGFN